MIAKQTAFSEATSCHHHERDRLRFPYITMMDTVIIQDPTGLGLQFSVWSHDCVCLYFRLTSRYHCQLGLDER